MSDIETLFDMDDFSEDKRKRSHVTAVVGLNQTEAEKEVGVYRLNCYAVRESQDQAEEPIEMGVVAVDGDVLRWVPTQDPNAACVGATNEAQWAKTAAGATITPTTDCHGDQLIRLVRIS